MKTALHRTIENTATVLSAFHGATRDCGPQFHNNDILLLAALTPPILVAFALTEIGAWTVHEIQRQLRIREKRPTAPSLRGTPTPDDLLDAWEADPRTLAIRLRLGSRLSDLDPTLDRTIKRRKLPNGKTVIKSRAGGMKGWLRDRRIAIPYPTAMRYKKLAQRLRQILSLDDRLPLEWLIDGLPPGQVLPADLSAPYAAARQRLAKILRENSSLASLSRFAEKELGIVRLVSVRRTPMHRRMNAKKSRRHKYFSVISHGRTATVSPERLEGTRTAIQRLLQAKNQSPAVFHLRERIHHWLSGLQAGSAPVPSSPSEP